MDYVIVGAIGGVTNAVAMWLWRRWRSRPTTAAMIRYVHDAMHNAPHDGRDYRQARAAIAAVERWRQ